MNEKGSRWHQIDIASLCQHLHTNAACGLSRKAARSRLKKEGRNPLFDDAAQKKNSPIKHFFGDPSILLMFFAVLLSIAFLSPLQVVFTLAIFVLIIAVLLYFWYKREELSRITARYRTPKVRVLRDGRVFIVSAARVVVGDVLLLHTGDVVPGDCRILSGHNLRVLTLQPNEKGQPTYREYAKHADATYPYGTPVNAPLAENMLYGGSEILCGEARAVLVAKGINSYLGAIRSFTVPAEVKERGGDAPYKKILSPYMRLWGILSLILLGLFTLIGLITKPTDGGLTEYFLILSILIAASSPAVLSLYLDWISLRGRFLCIEDGQPKNRAIIKTEAGLSKLAGVTDLFVVGKRGLCDGVTHFLSAFVGEHEIRAEDEEKSELRALCEAMLLRHESNMAMPTTCEQCSESDNVFLSELISLSSFDAGALKVRLQKVERDTYPNHPSWQCVRAKLQEGTTRYLFDSSGILMRHCLLYADGVRMRAVTPEYRATLRKYCEYTEEQGCRMLCVAKESSEGTLALVGVLALREQISAVLPSVVEELSQSGITTRFFLGDDDYARVCHLPQPYLYRSDENPSLTITLLQRYRTFIGFSKEELSALLPAYQKSAHRIAVLGGNADDRCFLRSGVLTFACDTVTDLSRYAESHIEESQAEDGCEGSHNTSQALRRHADVIIERADRFFGGAYAALQAISHSREVEMRMRMLLLFWLHSQLARFMMMTLAILTGIGFFSFLQMFLSGFAVEFAVLYIFSNIPIPQSALRRQNHVDGKFLSNTLFSKKRLLPTVIAVGITSLTVIILSLAGVLGAESVQTYLFFSLFFLQITVACRMLIAKKARPDKKMTLITVGILVGSILLLAILSSVIGPLGSVTGMGAWTVLTAILLPLMPVLYLVLTFLLPFLGRTTK